MQITLNNQTFEFDNVAKYLEFSVDNGEPKLVAIAWERIFDILQQSDQLRGTLKPEAFLEQMKVTLEFLEQIKFLSRWVNDAPRKRFYRDMKRSGAQILSFEYFFEQDGGDEIIDGLERTGNLAAKVCLIYGVEPMKPIEHNSSEVIPADDYAKYQIKK